MYFVYDKISKMEEEVIILNQQVRCDLAVEAKEIVTAAHGEAYSIPGVTIHEETVRGYIHITKVNVLDDEGERQLGKERGTYVTVEMPNRFYGEQRVYEEMCKTCAEVLKEMTDQLLPSEKETVLVVGLGNWNITADALGPKVLDSLMITRHLKEYMPEEIDEGIRPVCGVSPGVLGLTGVETGEIVKGIVNRVKPSLVIAIDALCARKIERINTTIQFSNTGITPGEGVGNRRKELSHRSLGVPVIAIGVPTVVDAATIASESMHKVLIKVKEEAEKNSTWYRFIQELEEKDHYQLIRESIRPTLGNFIVAPKEVDAIINDISGVIANGINIALHKGITLEDIDRYV